MVSNMAMGKNSIWWKAANIMVTGELEPNTAMAKSFGMMGHFMKVIGIMTFRKARALLLETISEYMWVGGRKTKSKGMENSAGQMERAIKEIIKLI